MEVPARADRKHAPLDEDAVTVALVSALGAKPSEEDRAAWLSMSPTQRRKALQRIATLKQWTNDRGGLTVEKAAERTGISAKRFYEMASAWRKRAGLAALGVFAKSQDRRSRLDPRAVNLLQSLLPRIIASDPRPSIDSMREMAVAQVKAAAAAASPPFDPALRIPSRMVVRRMIERGLGRSEAEALVGYDVAFDRCPLSLVDETGVRFTLFAVVDRATGLLLGVSLGQLPDSVAGFAAAAHDALDRLPRMSGLGAWAEATQRVELWAGPEADGAAVAAAIAGVPGGPDLNIATEGTPGRYLRAAVGDRLGRAEFRSAISLSKGQPVRESPVYSLAAARLEVMHGADAHNAALVDHAGNPSEPPENLVSLLRTVAALNARSGR